MWSLGLIQLGAAHCPRFLAIILVLLANRPPGDVIAADSIEWHSFRLETRVQHYNGKYGKLDIQVSEHYSHFQSRGRLSYRIERPNDSDASLDGEESGIYHVDAHYKGFSPDILLMSNLNAAAAGMSLSCSKVKASHVMERLGLAELDELMSGDGDLNIESDNAHLIGPFKLILYLNRRRNRMHTAVGERHQSVRGMDSVKYAMKLGDDSKEGQGSVSMDIFYSEVSLATGTHDIAIPNRITFRLRDRTIYFEIGTPKLDTDDSLSSVEPELNLGVQLDSLAIPRATGCSRVLPHLPKLFGKGRETNLATPSQFSFKARITIKRLLQKSVKLLANVALDHQIQAMRVDLETLNQPSKRINQIFNYYMNRMYLIFDERHWTTGQTENYRATIFEGNSADRARVSEAELRASASTRCVTARFCRKEQQVYALERLLFGANFFTYLGLAKVRGIRARVYESTDSELPYWLEHPIYISQAGGTYRRRKATGSLPEAYNVGSKTPGSQLVTVIYLTDEPNETNPKPLMIELFRMDPESRLVHERRTIELFDFHWRLAPIFASADQSAPSIQEIFSLADECSAPIEEARHVHVRLLLESVAASTVDAKLALMVQHNSERDLAVLAALQSDLDLMLSSIHDFKTQLLPRPAGQSGVGLVASFCMSRLSDIISSIAFVGLGNLINNRTGSSGVTTIYSLRTFSFQQCYSLSAHLAKPPGSYFAYEPETSWCHICTDSMDSEPDDSSSNFTDSKPLTMPFALSDDGDLEIYLTRQTRDSRFISSTWTHGDSAEQERLVMIQDKQLTIRSTSGLMSVAFNIKRLQINAHESHAVGRPGSGARSVEGKASGLEGYGYILNDERGNLHAHIVYSNQNVKEDDKQAISMNLGNCQAVCLTKLECKSFSFCVRGAHTECLLSRLDLNSKGLAGEIVVTGVRTKLNTKFNVDIGHSETRITLRRHSGCSIYAKQYLNYFTYLTPPVITNQLHNDQIRSVGDVEDCARWCFLRNVRYLSPQPRLTTFDERTPTTATSELSSCYAFNYIDRLNLQLLSEKDLARWKELVNDDQENSHIGGFCSIKLASGSEVGAISIKFDQQLRMMRYSLRVEDLYEETYGVSLKHSVIDVPSWNAKNEASSSAMPSEESIKLAEKLLARGDNFQVSMYANKATCASECFKQTTELWPACQSFDLIIERQKLTGIPRFKCVLNSITLKQAIANGRTDLIKSNSSSDSDILERRHFELITGVTDEPFIIKEEDEFSDLISILYGNSSRRGTGYHVLFSIIVVALGTGLMVGIFMAKYIRSRTVLSRHLRSHSLSSLATVMDLSSIMSSSNDNDL